jgi:uncharacterized protein (DUF1015 family)
MSEIRPFRALHPRPEHAAVVASVPYDVVDREEAANLAAGNPDSFLHVTRPEIDLPADADVHAPETYAKGRANLDDFLARGVLVQDAQPCLYAYRLTWQGRSQTGLVAGYSVLEYDQGTIKKHEFTRPDKEEDRTVHILTLGAQPGPVFLTYRSNEATAEALGAATAGAPWIDFEAKDGVRHTLWRVTETEPLVAAFGRLPALYVADGHHRSASASNVRKRRGAAGTLAPDDPAHHFLAVAFPDDEMRILGYHRLISELGGRSPEAFVDALRAVAPLEAVEAGEPTPRGHVRIYVGGQWWQMPLTPTADDPVARLDVQALEDRVLRPLLGIEDQRTDNRIQFVGGIRGTAVLAGAVDAGKAAVAFALAPVTTEELLAVADAGRVMPPKSTWFEPKLRSGLFVYPLS